MPYKQMRKEQKLKGEKEEKEREKGEKERYTHFKAVFQRIGKGDKKGFLSDQCKEIEKKNRMGMT